MVDCFLSLLLFYFAHKPTWMKAFTVKSKACWIALAFTVVLVSLTFISIALSLFFSIHHMLPACLAKPSVSLAFALSKRTRRMTRYQQPATCQRDCNQSHEDHSGCWSPQQQSDSKGGLMCHCIDPKSYSGYWWMWQWEHISYQAWLIFGGLSHVTWNFGMSRYLAHFQYKTELYLITALGMLGHQFEDINLCLTVDLCHD